MERRTRWRFSPAGGGGRCARQSGSCHCLAMAGEHAVLAQATTALTGAVPLRSGRCVWAGRAFAFKGQSLRVARRPPGLHTGCIGGRFAHHTTLRMHFVGWIPAAAPPACLWSSSTLRGWRAWTCDKTDRSGSICKPGYHLMHRFYPLQAPEWCGLNAANVSAVAIGVTECLCQ
jgi:hypothetical protein